MLKSDIIVRRTKLTPHTGKINPSIPVGDSKFLELIHLLCPHFSSFGKMDSEMEIIFRHGTRQYSYRGVHCIGLNPDNDYTSVLYEHRNFLADLQLTGLSIPINPDTVATEDELEATSYRPFMVISPEGDVCMNQLNEGHARRTQYHHDRGPTVGELRPSR